MRGLEPI